MIKTLTNLFKQDKEQFVVPKGVQDCMPAFGISQDGIIRLTKYPRNGMHKFSKTFRKSPLYMFKSIIQTKLIIASSMRIKGSDVI